MNVLSLILNAHIKNLFYKLNVHGGKEIYIVATCRQTPFLAECCSISPALNLEDVQNFFNPIFVHASQLKAAYSSRNSKDLKVPSLIVCCTH